MKNVHLTLSALLAFTPLAAGAQQEGLLPTQTLVQADSRDNIAPIAGDIKLQVNSRNTPLNSLTVLQPNQIQVALLIDDGLSRSAGIQLNDLRTFASTLPPQMELLVGYMSNGTVDVVVPFTHERAEVADKIRLPMGIPGQSASPYFCLSDFVKRWPDAGGDEGGNAHGKARFVIMITDGVDPYNGSVSILNQDSPYVATAVRDAQRAGVSVSSIYYRDAGIRGGAASFSGQSYLAQVSEGTGGNAYYQGSFNPVSLTPFFQQFTHALAETYVATFGADVAAAHDHLVRIKMSTSQSKMKLRYPDSVRPGNTEAASASSAAGRMP